MVSSWRVLGLPVAGLGKVGWRVVTGVIEATRRVRYRAGMTLVAIIKVPTP
jgi:hypothetical protein